MGKKQKNRGGLVYSTDPQVGNSFFNQLDLGPSTDKKDQVIRVWLEKKHRGGKEVAVIKGLEESEARLKEIAKIIKSNCGVGGSVKDGEIIIQGDHRNKIIDLLHKEGYPNVKKAGG